MLEEKFVLEEFVFEEMTPALQEYLDFTGSFKYGDGDYEVFREKKEAMEKVLPTGLLNKYYRLKQIWMCRDATINDQSPIIEKSPSGKYSLHVTSHGTKLGSWAYTKGRVYEGERLIAEICRNYSSFPHLFIENHPNGRDFLICGEDYQGQTVVELDTGKCRNNLSDGTNKGHGFCWSSYEFHQDSQILVVTGCVWACPYEFRFYDFSDPINGWPEIETGDYIYEDRKAPIIEGNILKVFETEANDDDDNDEVEPIKPGVERTIKTFRREGNKFVLLEEFVSEAEKTRRIRREEGEKAFEAWLKNFKTNDPLYLAYRSHIENDRCLSPEDYESHGITYDTWCPDFKGNEKRWCRRIVGKRCRRIVGKRGRDKGYTLDLEWAVETGPVKLEIYKDGKSHDTKFFPHSIEGMDAAFKMAKDLVS